MSRSKVTRSLWLVALLALLVWAAAPVARASDYTWSNLDADSDWQNVNNWTPNDGGTPPPGYGDIAHFDGPGAGYGGDVNLNVLYQQVGQIDINGQDSSDTGYVIGADSSANLLEVNLITHGLGGGIAGITNEIACQLQGEGGMMTITVESGKLLISGQIGPDSQIDVTGSEVSDGNLTLSNTANDIGGTIRVSGTGVLTGTDGGTLGSATIVLDGGTLELKGPTIDYVPGLEARYYHSNSGTGPNNTISDADLGTMTPNNVVIDTAINFAGDGAQSSWLFNSANHYDPDTGDPVTLSGYDNDFSVRWDGFVMFASDPTTRINIRTDDGGYVTFAGLHLETNNNESRGDVTLVAGVYTPITMSQHEWGGGDNAWLKFLKSGGDPNAGEWDTNAWAWGTAIEAYLFHLGVGEGNPDYTLNNVDLWSTSTVKALGEVNMGILTVTAGALNVTAGGSMNDALSFTQTVLQNNLVVNNAVPVSLGALSDGGGARDVTKSGAGELLAMAIPAAPITPGTWTVNEGPLSITGGAIGTSTIVLAGGNLNLYERTEILHVNGAWAKFFAGYNGTGGAITGANGTGWDAYTPNWQGIVPVVDWPVGPTQTVDGINPFIPYLDPFQNDNISSMAAGFIKVDVAGNYVFWSGSDDGSRLWMELDPIGNPGVWTMVVDNNRDQGYPGADAPPLSPYSDSDPDTAGKQGYYLDAGEYAFRHGWFEGGGGAGTELHWWNLDDGVLPDLNDHNRLIPNSNLFCDALYAVTAFGNDVDLDASAAVAVEGLAEMGKLTIGGPGLVLAVTSLGGGVENVRGLTFTGTAYAGLDWGLDVGAGMSVSVGRLDDQSSDPDINKTGAGDLVADYTVAPSDAGSTNINVLDGRLIVVGVAGGPDPLANLAGTAWATINMQEGNDGLILSSKSGNVAFGSAINVNGNTTMTAGQAATGVAGAITVNLNGNLTVAADKRLIVKEENGYNLVRTNANVGGDGTLEVDSGDTVALNGTSSDALTVEIDKTVSRGTAAWTTTRGSMYTNWQLGARVNDTSATGIGTGWTVNVRGDAYLDMQAVAGQVAAMTNVATLGGLGGDLTNYVYGAGRNVTFGQDAILVDKTPAPHLPTRADLGGALLLKGVTAIGTLSAYTAGDDIDAVTPDAIFNGVAFSHFFTTAGAFEGTLTVDPDADSIQIALRDDWTFGGATQGAFINATEPDTDTAVFTGPGKLTLAGTGGVTRGITGNIKNLFRQGYDEDTNRGIEAADTDPNRTGHTHNLYILSLDQANVLRNYKTMTVTDGLVDIRHAQAISAALPEFLIPEGTLKLGEGATLWNNIWDMRPSQGTIVVQNGGAVKIRDWWDGGAAEQRSTVNGGAQWLWEDGAWVIVEDDDFYWVDNVDESKDLSVMNGGRRFYGAGVVGTVDGLRLGQWSVATQGWDTWCSFGHDDESQEWNRSIVTNASIATGADHDVTDVRIAAPRNDIYVDTNVHLLPPGDDGSVTTKANLHINDEPDVLYWLNLNEWDANMQQSAMNGRVVFRGQDRGNGMVADVNDLIMHNGGLRIEPAPNTTDRSTFNIDRDFLLLRGYTSVDWGNIYVTRNMILEGNGAHYEQWHGDLQVGGQLLVKDNSILTLHPDWDDYQLWPLVMRETLGGPDTTFVTSVIEVEKGAWSRMWYGERRADTTIDVISQPYKLLGTGSATDPSQLHFDENENTGNFRGAIATDIRLADGAYFNPQLDWPANRVTFFMNMTMEGDATATSRRPPIAGGGQGYGDFGVYGLQSDTPGVQRTLLLGEATTTDNCDLTIIGTLSDVYVRNNRAYVDIRNAVWTDAFGPIPGDGNWWRFQTYADYIPGITIPTLADGAVIDAGGSAPTPAGGDSYIEMHSAMLGGLGFTSTGSGHVLLGSGEDVNIRVVDRQSGDPFVSEWGAKIVVVNNRVDAYDAYLRSAREWDPQGDNGTPDDPSDDYGADRPINGVGYYSNVHPQDGADLQLESWDGCHTVADIYLDTGVSSARVFQANDHEINPGAGGYYGQQRWENDNWVNAVAGDGGGGQVLTLAGQWTKLAADVSGGVTVRLDSGHGIGWGMAQMVQGFSLSADSVLEIICASDSLAQQYPLEMVPSCDTLTQGTIKLVGYDDGGTRRGGNFEVERGYDGTVVGLLDTVNVEIYNGRALGGMVAKVGLVGDPPAPVTNVIAAPITINADNNANTMDGGLYARRDFFTAEGANTGTVQFNNVTMEAPTAAGTLQLGANYSGPAKIQIGVGTGDGTGLHMHGDTIVTGGSSDTTIVNVDGASRHELTLQNAAGLVLAGDILDATDVNLIGTARMVDGVNTTDILGQFKIALNSTLELAPAGTITPEMNIENTGTVHAMSGETDMGAGVITGTPVPAAYFSGLAAGRVTNVGQPDGNINEVTPNPRTEIVPGTTHADSTAGGSAEWPDNSTWIFNGQILVNDTNGDGTGTIAFAENFDDFVILKIDDVQYMHDGGWDTETTTGGLTLSATWHTFEARFGQGGGGVGPVEGWPFGFGYNANASGGVTDPPVSGEYVAPRDPGDMSLFRVWYGDPNTASITVDASATLRVGGFTNASSVTVNGLLALNSVTSDTKALAIDSAGGARFDINDGQLIVDYESGSNPKAQIEAYITSGFNDYAWDGPGIMSTAAHNDPDQYRAVGWIDNAEYGYGEFPEGGTAVDETAILVAHTLYGDADLNLTVNFDDYYQWQAGYDDGQAGNPDGYVGWLWGDFDYNGAVNFDDYYLWQAGYDYVQGGGVLATGAEGGLSAIPEPATLALMAAGLAAMALRKRKSL